MFHFAFVALNKNIRTLLCVFLFRNYNKNNNKMKAVLIHMQMHAYIIP
jgi:hypothetical protein